MAKLSPKEQKEELDFLQKQKAAYESAQKVIQQYNKANQQTKVELEGQLIASRKIIQSFIQQFKSIKGFNDILEKTGTSYEKVAKSTKKYGDSLDDLLNPSEELLDLQNSILNTHGKQSAEYDIINTKIKSQRTSFESISKVMSDLDGISDHQREIALEAVEAYKSQDATVGQLRKRLAKGEITQKEFNDSVIELSGYWDDIINKIDTTNPSLNGLYEMLKSINSEAAAFNLAEAKASNYKMQGIKGAGEVASRTLGDPTGFISAGTDIAAGSVGRGDAALKAAGTIGLIIGALGILKSLNNFYQELNKAQYDALKLFPQMDEEINNINISLGRGTTKSKNFVKALAELDFRGELRQAGAQFEAASKTAFFGRQLTGIKYNTQLLQLAGFSAERITSAMKTMSSVAGLNNNSDLSAGISILSQNMGLAEDATAGIISSFKLLDTIGAKKATDNLVKFRYDAEQAGINIGTASENLADAAKDALKYQIRSSAELGKQVMFASKLGLSFKSIAEAGRQSVLDYQGQIEAERELETFIQRGVNLSRYRSLMAQPGGQDAAIKELQSMDFLNPLTNPKLATPMAQQALMDMLKMDLSDIQKIFSKGYVERTPLDKRPEELSLKSLNEQYLETFKNAMSNLKVVTAEIDADQATLRAPIETELKALQTTDVFNIAKRAEVATLEAQQQLENMKAIAADIANPGKTGEVLKDQRIKQLDSYIKSNPGVSLKAAGIPTMDDKGFVAPSAFNREKFSLKPINTTPLTSLDEKRFLKDETLKISMDELKSEIKKLNENGLGLQVDTVVKNESGKVLYEKARKYQEYQKGIQRGSTSTHGLATFSDTGKDKF